MPGQGGGHSTGAAQSAPSGVPTPLSLAASAISHTVGGAASSAPTASGAADGPDPRNPLMALLALSLAGSLYITAGLARRLAVTGLRWSAGRTGRRILVVMAGLACLAGLASFWATAGQFRGW